METHGVQMPVIERAADWMEKMGHCLIYCQQAGPSKENRVLTTEIGNWRGATHISPSAFFLEEIEKGRRHRSGSLQAGADSATTAKDD